MENNTESYPPKSNLSQPIILFLENLSDHDLTDIELLHAAERAWDIPFINGNYKTDELAIGTTSNNSLLSYKTILRNIALGDCFTIGKTHILVVTGPNVQEYVFGINMYSLSGTYACKHIVLSNSVELPHVNISSEKYDIDKSTSLVLRVLKRNATIGISLYPTSDKIFSRVLSSGNGNN